MILRKVGLSIRENAFNNSKFSRGLAKRRLAREGCFLLSDRAERYTTFEFDTEHLLRGRWIRK
jgi:hypothetical protein